MGSGVNADSSNMNEETLVKTNPYMLRVDSFQLYIYHSIIFGCMVGSKDTWIR